MYFLLNTGVMILSLCSVTDNWMFSSSRNVSDNAEDGSDWAGGGNVDFDVEDSSTTVSTSTAHNCNNDISTSTKPTHTTGLNYNCSDWLCESATNTKYRGCACDELCLLFGDCCIDAFNVSTYLGSFKSALSLVTVILPDRSDLKLVLELAGYSECREVVESGNEANYYQLVVRCPESTNSDSEVKEKCEKLPADDFRNIVVTLKSKPFLTLGFRNVYCAYCHGYSGDEVDFWNASLSCAPNLMKVDNYASLIGHCELFQKSVSAASKVRRCFKPEFSICDGDVITHDYILCRAYFAPIKIGPIQYQNVHCALCIGKIISHYSCVRGSIGSDFENPDRGHMDLSMLFNFNGNDISWDYGGATYKQSQRKCEEKYIYDPIFQQCKLANCPDIFIKKDGNCMSDRTFYISPPEIKANETPNAIYINFYTNKIDDEYDFGRYLQAIMDDKSTDIKIDKIDIPIFETSNSTYILIHNMTADDAIHEVIELLQDYYKAIDDGKISKIVLRNYENTSYLFCNTGSFIVTDDATIKSDKDHYSIEMKDLNISLSLHNTRYNIEILNHSVVPTNVFYCNQTLFQEHCSNIISYSTENYHIQNNKVVFNSSGLSFGNASYVLFNSTLYLCVDTVQTSVEEKPNPASFIITVVTIVASLICLMGLIIITSCIKQLRNLHGKCLLCFSITLFTGLALLISSVYLPTEACPCVAILLHYVWLSSFCWSSTMAFDLARRLSIWTMMTANHMNDNVIFKRYFVFAFGFPFCFVTTCVVIDQTALGISMGYGQSGLCWIGNSEASLYTFGLPVAIALVFNLVCFIVTLHGVEYAKRSTKNLKKSKKEKSRCVMYTKISVMLGLTWVISYIAELVNVPWLKYLAICITGSQGVFIFVGFIQNARVIDSICKMRKRKSERSSTQNQTSLHNSDISTSTCNHV